MATENINNIISPEALKQLDDLITKLAKSKEAMEELIISTNNYQKALSSSSNVKEITANVTKLNQESEKLNQTNSERLNIERQIKTEAEKMVASIQNEKEAMQNLNKVLEQNTNNSYEAASNSNRLRMEQENLKNSISTLKNNYKQGSISIEEYNGRLAELTVKQAETTILQQKATAELKNAVKEDNSIATSMQQKSLQLEKLKAAYRGLSEEERSNVAIGVTLKNAINSLDEEMKGLDSTIGNNQRNVGNYNILQEQAEVATQSLRTQIRGINQDFALNQLALDKLNEKISQQKSLVNQLITTKGKESQEYIEQKAALDKLTESQITAQAAMQKLQKEGARLQNALGDARGTTKALSSDFANTDAAVKGVGVMVDTFTVFQSVMVGLGIESEEVMNIFAKLMILQQGVNSLQQITNALQSESILRIKLHSAWLLIKGEYLKRLAIAQGTAIVTETASTTATEADTVAKGLNNAVTGASVGILGKATAAVKAFTVALMKNPLVLLITLLAGATIGIIKFISSQRKEKIEAFNKVLEAQAKGFEKDNKQIESTTRIMQAMGASELTIIKYKKEHYRVSMLQAKYDLSAVLANKKATKEQIKTATETYNAQNQLYAESIENFKIAEIEKTTKLVEEVKDRDKKELEKEKEKNKQLGEEKTKYYNDIKLLALEQQANTDKEVLDLAISNLEKQSKSEIDKYNLKGEEKKTVEDYYGNEITKLKKEYADKQDKIIDDSTKEILDLTENLYREELQNGTINEEQLTNNLISLQKSRYDQIKILNEKAKQEELATLEVGSAAYYAVLQKWKLQEQQAEIDNNNEIQGIKDEGFEKRLASIKKQAEALKNAQTLGGDGLTYSESIKIELDAIQQEIDAYTALGETQTNYAANLEALQTKLALSSKEYTDSVTADLLKEKQARLEVAQTTSDAFFSIANALADGVEDELQQVKIQQGLALAQVLLNQGIAISSAVAAATPGDPYTVAIRVIAAVGAVVAQFITAKNAINEAKNAYAEGTDYHMGGSALTGEGGEPELIIANKKTFVVDKPTYFKDLPVGAKVIPFSDLSNYQNYADFTETNFLLKELKNKPTAVINVGSRITQHLKSEFTMTRILNNKFRA